MPFYSTEKLLLRCLSIADINVTGCYGSIRNGFAPAPSKVRWQHRRADSRRNASGTLSIYVFLSKAYNYTDVFGLKALRIIDSPGLLHSNCRVLCCAATLHGHGMTFFFVV